MKKASELIEQLFSSIEQRFPDEKRYISIFSSWETLVGIDLGSHSAVKEIEGSTLVVEADHPSWAQIITLRQPAILKKLHRDYPELQIDRIRIIIT